MKLSVEISPRMLSTSLVADDEGREEGQGINTGERGVVRGAAARLGSGGVWWRWMAVLGWGEHRGVAQRVRGRGVPFARLALDVLAQQDGECADEGDDVTDRGEQEDGVVHRALEWPGKRCEHQEEGREQHGDLQPKHA